MTKDRRLGKGLAALLGTPLEEHDSGGASMPDAPSKPSAAASHSSVTKSPSASSTSAQVGKLPVQAVAGQPMRDNASQVKREVTGAVSLKQFGTPRGVLEIPVSEIDNNPFQPRRKFNDEELASLAESIREHEQLQPILVRQVGNRYQLISGERRLRAAIRAGLSRIRAEVREADDRLVAELAIVENLQRKDLDAIEKAMSFRRYIDQHQCKQEDLAKRLKIDRSTIANLMRLLELPEEIQQWIQQEKMTAGHARALLPLGEEEQQMDFARQIMGEGWSVRETERRVAETLEAEDEQEGLHRPSGSRTANRPSPQIAALEQQLRLSLGTKTDIRQNARGRGKIVISFANPEEFERICSLLCPRSDSKAA